MSSGRAAREAERRASEIMSNLAALHDPDMGRKGARRIHHLNLLTALPEPARPAPKEMA